MNQRKLTHLALRFIKAGRDCDTLGYLRLLRETQDLPDEITRELVMICNGLLDEYMPGADRWLTEMVNATSQGACPSCGAVPLTGWSNDRLKGWVTFEHLPGCSLESQYDGQGGANPSVV
jgi:hypothetical protein